MRTITDEMIDKSKGFTVKRRNGEVAARFDNRPQAEEYMAKHRGLTLSFFLKEEYQ